MFYLELTSVSEYCFCLYDECWCLSMYQCPIKNCCNKNLFASSWKCGQIQNFSFCLIVLFSRVMLCTIGAILWETLIYYNNPFLYPCSLFYKNSKSVLFTKMAAAASWYSTAFLCHSLSPESVPQREFLRPRDPLCDCQAKFMPLRVNGVSPKTKLTWASIRSWILKC